MWEYAQNIAKEVIGCCIFSLLKISSSEKSRYLYNVMDPSCF